jgi:hypothetical protein
MLPSASSKEDNVVRTSFVSTVAALAALGLPIRSSFRALFSHRLAAYQARRSKIVNRTIRSGLAAID